MADFDAIVVGSGCAGSIAAYELANAGKAVLVIERGNYPGAKNMTGGRIYAHTLKEIFPDFESEGPVERKITHERISLMSPNSNFTMDFGSDEMNKEEQASYSVCRATLDQWLSEQAENAGAEYIPGIPVEELVKDENGKVIGVKAGEDELTAEVVILCDGVNSLLTEQAVGAKRPPASGVAVGVKDVIELPANVITDRVLANSDDEGAAWLFAGDCTKGKFGGGFVYTNKESISVGIVAGIEGMAEDGDVPVYQMLDDLKNSPAVAPLIKDGKVIEHSGHMVPEGGWDIMPEVVGDGVLLAGDNAMMCINLGYMVRGMDYAMAAGKMAAEAAIKAIDAGDTSKAGLSSYKDALEDSFVMKDFKTFKLVPDFMEHFDRMFCGYPEMVRDIMNTMFVVDGTPMKHLQKSVMPIVQKMGMMKLFKDVRGALKAL